MKLYRGVRGKDNERETRKEGEKCDERVGGRDGKKREKQKEENETAVKLFKRCGRE